MSPELAVAIAAGIIILIPAIVTVAIKIPKKLKTDKFTTQWQQVQAHCKDKLEWKLAISEADKLLDIALKRRKIKGKSMGERMVSAQRMFTNNDATWFAHNLSKKLIADPKIRLREADVKSALIGFRQALRDLGALNDGQPKDS